MQFELPQYLTYLRYYCVPTASRVNVVISQRDIDAKQKDKK